jgi:hypothetical protein
MPASSGATEAKASFSESSPRTSSRSATWIQTPPDCSENTRQSRPSNGRVLKPPASGAKGASGADAERASSRPAPSRTWKAILVS